MKRLPKSQKTIIGLLTNPDPRFVSLVDHGAVQRPFHAVKRRDHANTKEAPMPENAQHALKIHRIVFDAENFTDAEAVKTYMTGKSYEDFTVSEVDGGFAVVDEANEAGLPTRKVNDPSNPGVTYEVIDASEGDDSEDSQKSHAAPGAETDEDKATSKDADADSSDSATDDNAADSPSHKADSAGNTSETHEAPKAKEATPAPRQRVRPGTLVVAGKSVNRLAGDHEAFVEGQTTLKSFAEMLENYNGSMPPGMYDIADAFMGSLRKMFSAGEVDQAEMQRLANDFISGAMNLYDVYQGILATKAVDGSDSAELEALLSLLFDPTPDATTKALREVISDLREDVSKSATKLAEAEAERKAAQDELAFAEVEYAEAIKRAKGERVLPGRKSTDEPDTGTQSPDEAAQAETQKRATARLMGRNAARNMH